MPAITARRLLVATLVLASCTAIAKEVPRQAVGRASVVDGDTLEIHGTRIRLWGIDALESSQVCTAADGRKWRGGAQAANQLSEFIGTRTVKCERRDIDRYGRMVATCRVGKQDLGGWLVENGWAYAFTRYAKAYVPHQERAQMRRRGVHAAQCDRPWEYRSDRRHRDRDGYHKF